MNQALNIVNNKELLQQLKVLMWQAADAILEVYDSNNFEAEIKADNSPVTKADLAAHHILNDGLASLTPNIPVVSEEDKNSLSVPKTSNIFWLIDPLDGTKEFIKRNGEFTCNLALIEEGSPTLGFVGIPAKAELYIGGEQIPSTVETQNKSVTLIQHRYKSGVTRVVASKSHLNEDTQNFINKIEGNVELVQAGSSLKFLKIATGEADIYPRLAPTCEWDTAAAHAVLNGAGGQVTQVSGEPLAYGKNEILNPFFIAAANK